ncbi:SCO0607 family lipoprotein [Catenuloplanes atrovinosus]|uniref:Lipoprotein n=1 Tax=Catenuloplanes atrovinosus TaxID=137266 RepID=A0AAE4CD84_9ACTN|nr:hypothetical protein [Catenuloplanes atrovinosus]MDR7278789.1 hypothetical protein [Catenuloplanes atrovinosus]
MRTLTRLLPLLTLTTVIAGCSFQESICAGGEYPVKAIGNATGRACVADGEEPPSGYVRYPDGQVPEHLGDEWDTYWSSRIIHEDGTITEAS